MVCYNYLEQSRTSFKKEVKVKSVPEISSHCFVIERLRYLLNLKIKFSETIFLNLMHYLKNLSNDLIKKAVYYE